MKTSTLRPSQAAPERRPEPTSFDLRGAHYEVPDVDLAIAEELRELRATIAELEERVAELRAGRPSPARPRRARSAVEPEVTR